MLLASMAYFYTTAGMETALLVFLIMLALTLITEGRLAWLPAVLILLALTRFEAGALIPVCLVFFYKKKTWPPVISYVPALAIVAAYLITNHHFFGAFLPQSANAKLGQGRSEYWGSWPMGFLLINPLLNTFNGVRLVLPLLIAGALIGAFRMRSSNWNALTLPFAAIMLAFYVLFNIPDYTWYYAPFILLLVLFAAAALPSTRLTMVCVLCVVVVQFVAAEHVLSAPEERYENYKQLAYWINSNALPGATVEACEIGEIGWDSTHPIIDILGLNMPKNAVHIAHKDAASWLKEDRPDYVVMHRKTWVWEKVAFNSPEYEVAPFSAGDVYLLRRKGVIDKSNDHP
jgi:arabinofuranosyltransferase